MICSALLTKLHATKQWLIDDEQHLWEGVVDNPHDYATWDDVDHCLNNPHF